MQAYCFRFYFLLVTVIISSGMVLPFSWKEAQINGITSSNRKKHSKPASLSFVTQRISTNTPQARASVRHCPVSLEPNFKEAHQHFVCGSVAQQTPRRCFFFLRYCSRVCQTGTSSPTICCGADGVSVPDLYFFCRVAVGRTEVRAHAVVGNG